MFALIDGNNFYARCERVFQPELRNKPLIVLSNNNGCAIARSEEAKALGITMGHPIHKVPLGVRRKLAIRSANFGLYGNISARIGLERCETMVAADQQFDAEILGVSVKCVQHPQQDLGEIISVSKPFARLRDWRGVLAMPAGHRCHRSATLNATSSSSSASARSRAGWSA